MRCCLQQARTFNPAFTGKNPVSSAGPDAPVVHGAALLHLLLGRDLLDDVDDDEHDLTDQTPGENNEDGEVADAKEKRTTG
jgi:hypothetical protein